MTASGGGDAAVPPQAKQEVWPFEGEPGFRRSIQHASSVAATLLAGFAFTFFVLVFRSLGSTKTVVEAGPQTRVITQSQALSAIPEVGAALFLIAGLLFLAAVQAGVTIGYHDIKPGELAEIYPEYVHTGPEEPGSQLAEKLGESDEGWPPMYGDGKWYAGWMRRYFFESNETARKWALATRHVYHAALVFLLLGLTVLAIPPHWSGPPARWVLVALAAFGTCAEIAWIRSVRVARRTK
jgi:hypothetical protein